MVAAAKVSYFYQFAYYSIFSTEYKESLTGILYLAVKLRACR